MAGWLANPGSYRCSLRDSAILAQFDNTSQYALEKFSKDAVKC